MSVYPVRKFEHLDEHFDPQTPVPDDHPMVVARPDLFADKPSTTKKPTKE